jgi:hypothetical protein
LKIKGLCLIIKVGTGVANNNAKAPFSSPVAGSGKPFLPSLTLPVNRDFFYLKPDLKSKIQYPGRSNQIKQSI